MGELCCKEAFLNSTSLCSEECKKQVTICEKENEHYMKCNSLDKVTQCLDYTTEIAGLHASYVDNCTAPAAAPENYTTAP